MLHCADDAEPEVPTPARPLGRDCLHAWERFLGPLQGANRLSTEDLGLPIGRPYSSLVWNMGPNASVPYTPFQAP